ncbi:MAG: hypothetical protein EP330_15685 [Deltaproteobacteria bacterium]|nr:MAG: hypothetical protein EP330_15685 [Deltaproteobacteria bacterium]
MVANLLVPAFFADLYPFSAYTMFSHRPTSLSWVEFEDADGKRVKPAAYGVHNHYLANPHVRPGMQADGLVRFLGEPLTEQEVRDTILPRMAPGETLSIRQMRMYRDDQGKVHTEQTDAWSVEAP